MEPIIYALMTRKPVHRIPSDETSEIVDWTYADNLERDMMNTWQLHSPLASLIVSVHQMNAYAGISYLIDNLPGASFE